MKIPYIFWRCEVQYFVCGLYEIDPSGGGLINKKISEKGGGSLGICPFPLWILKCGLFGSIQGFGV